MRPGGGAVNAAIAVGRAGRRAGLAITVGDDVLGYAFGARIAREPIAAIAERYAGVRTGLVLLERAGDGPVVIAYRAPEEPRVEVPETWEAPVLLISGLVPGRAHATGMRAAARDARRHGRTVVIDVNARRRLWTGHDPAAIRAVLREADVVKCSRIDLAVLGRDAASMQREMRRSAALIVTDGPDAARALGPFGEVARATKAIRGRDPSGAGDAFAAAVAMAIARGGNTGASTLAGAGADFWDDVLERGHAAARDHLRRARR